MSSQDNQKSARLETLQPQRFGKSRMLLHCCCAPCASYVISHLLPSYDISLFFYNPNIEPEAEYAKRKSELERLAAIYSLHNETCFEIVDSGYDNVVFKVQTDGLESQPEGGERCVRCFNLRLEETARQAKNLGYDIFATTLSVSPHKNAAILSVSGITQSTERDILYHDEDYKKNGGYMRSLELSKEYELYRQDYCGCEYSKRRK